jgi:hypothetical protein
MPKTPFHRRILPWLFTIIFLIMAPAVVFYTSGYRWNPKKHAIERNGTLIIDTRPAGASIKLNGKAIPETSPVTLQNMAPGNYLIELELKGYHPWSKMLWVEPEKVTFASDIVLWPVSDPVAVSEAKIVGLFSDPDSDFSLVVTADSDKATSFGTLDEKTGKITKSVTADQVITPETVQWKPGDANKILVYGKTGEETSPWLIRFSPASATKLPMGTYHWQSDTLVGYASGSKLTINSDTGLNREPLTGQVQDTLDTWRLESSAQTGNQILLKGENAKEGVILPSGQWRLWSDARNTLVLRDQNRWLWTDMAAEPSISYEARGDWLLPITYKRQTLYAFKNSNEAWVWEKDQEPELIDRQSDPLVSVSWHTDGRDLMVATKNEIQMFSLDNRNGRYKTVLATFDQIDSAIVLGDTAFVAGTKNGKQGLWRLPLAFNTSRFPTLSSLGF